MGRKYTIKELRKARGLSQWDLSRQTGVSRVQISNLERFVHVPSGPTLQKISRVLGVDANDIDLSYAEAA